MPQQTLQIDYISPIGKYQVLRQENDTAQVLRYVASSIELIGCITAFLNRSYRTQYQLAYSKQAWKRLSPLERETLNGIVDLHKRAVKNSNTKNSNPEHPD